jgi:hypothetical protein
MSGQSMSAASPHLWHLKASADGRIEHIFKAVRSSVQYEAPYWFVSQLFESNWEPRESHEHSPLSDDAYLAGKDQLVTEKGMVIPLDPLLRPDIEEGPAKRPNQQPSR